MKIQLKNGHVHMGEVVSEDEPFKLRSKEQQGAHRFRGVSRKTAVLLEFLVSLK